MLRCLFATILLTDLQKTDSAFRNKGETLMNVDPTSKAIIDSLQVTGIYGISEKDHTILFFNRKISELIPNIKVGMDCCGLWNKSCKNCPLNFINVQKIIRTIHYNHPFGAVTEMTATRIIWNEDTPAFLIRLYPHIEDNRINKKLLAAKNKPLSLYTIDEDYNIISYSDNAKQIFPQIATGEKCYQNILGFNIPCEGCPITSKHTESTTDQKNCTPYSSFAINLIGNKKGYSIAFHDASNYSYNIHMDDVISFANMDEPYRDMLTGGFNRAGFIRAVKTLQKNGTKLSDYTILFVNINRFKAINEIFGSVAGDHLLRTLYLRFYLCGLKPKLSARKESDHFVFLVKRNALNYHKLMECLDFHWQYGKDNIAIHCRCGIYHISDENEEISKMIDRARLAKDYIKDDYVEPYAVFEEKMQEGYIKQMEALSAYRLAIANKEFHIYYQPIISSKTGKVASAEALIRWIKPGNKIIAPNTFLPTLEKYGYITELDSFVLNTVHDYLYELYQANKPFVPISINLSRMDLVDTNLLKEFKRKVLGSKLPTNSLRYEFTETAYAHLEEYQTDFIRFLRQNGRKILVDDFGSGYSSFGMMLKLEFDILKIDRNFIMQIGNNHKARRIIKVILAMCRTLGIATVAEGVETQEEVDFLRKNRCDYLQGYYFSKPLNREMFEEFLKKHM